MEEHFNENYMESGKYPKSVFKGSIRNLSDINFAENGKYPAKVEGDLTIHGVTQPVTVEGEGQWIDGSLEVIGAVDITLSQFDVERPSSPGRSARDEAVVEFKLRFVPAGG